MRGKGDEGAAACCGDCGVDTTKAKVSSSGGPSIGKTGGGKTGGGEGTKK